MVIGQQYCIRQVRSMIRLLRSFYSDQLDSLTVLLLYQPYKMEKVPTFFRGARASVFNRSVWASFSRWSQSSSNKRLQARTTLSHLLWMRHGVIRGAPSSHCTPVELTSSRRVRDLTGQLLNIPQHPVAYGGYSDVWKCDWIKDGTILKVIQQFRFKTWQLNIDPGCCKGDQAARCKQWWCPQTGPQGLPTWRSEKLYEKNIYREVNGNSKSGWSFDTTMSCSCMELPMSFCQELPGWFVHWKWNSHQLHYFATWFESTSSVTVGECLKGDFYCRAELFSRSATLLMASAIVGTLTLLRSTTLKSST